MRNPMIRILQSIIKIDFGKMFYRPDLLLAYRTVNWIVLLFTFAWPLALEAMDPDVMIRPPRRPDKPLLNSFVIFGIFLVALMMAGGTVGLFLWEYQFEISNDE